MILQDFWARQGCLIWQPYYTQVGAGTYNPATILRVLGPEPWQVAYVEPSVRPDDGRYGENPNRLQMHYQFQVILKPDPGNPQELYLNSLEALGIDPRQHDIRFVEDKWESPALGAWGLGWEVWLDGQEITQFTYFQQAGGQTLDPVSVEITYGLDRIAIGLQRVTNFRDVRWSPAVKYGEVNLQGEQEHSRYYFNIANVERARQMYDLFETEANACLDQGLVLPALDYILKCSHTFNILDARGAVGVTERQAFFGRMRDLTRRTSEAYLAQRQYLEYPWLAENPPAEETSSHIVDQTQLEPGRISSGQPGIQLTAPFLLEIGTEELPVADLDSALEQLRQKIPAVLAELHLGHGEVSVLGTPRRLVVYVKELEPRQPDLEIVAKGPPAKRAFGPGGEPTAAAEGFARSKGVSANDLLVREIDGGSYVVAIVRQPGQPVGDILAKILPEIIAELRFEKSIRWNRSNMLFSRPVRWLMALYGQQVIPFEFAGVDSGRQTRGLRFREPSEFIIRDPGEYFKLAYEQGILLDPVERKVMIQQQVHALADEVGGVLEDDPGLLSEVTNLVESPQALRGSFDAIHLELPREVLISVMKKHQRYFPVFEAANGGANLLPYFITVRNGDREGRELAIEGNEHVIRARFADASFFVREDLKHSLESYLPRLQTLTFQTRLGSMLDKTHRLVRLMGDLAPLLNLTADEMDTARRAAELCKADLATHMVVEMTSLQGIMGRFYALHSKETADVALAIYEHNLPRFAGDEVPKTHPGLLIGLADRLDSLTGLFAVGLSPSGNKDPFGQRRAALGIVQSLLTWDVDFDLRPALSRTAVQLPLPVDEKLLETVIDFITERLRNTLQESGVRYDVVDAVLAEQRTNPARAGRATRQFTNWISRADWNVILPAYARCVRITRSLGEVFTVQPEFFYEPSEFDLWEALLLSETTPRSEGSVDDFLNAFLPMIPAVNQFFNDVLVMSEDLNLRRNRLGMLQRIAGLAKGTADLSKLEGF